MHYHYIEDSTGDVVDLVPFCCDARHRAWCDETGETYGGWNGCNEGGDYPEWCEWCGVFAGGTAQCECQLRNVVVNRFRCDEPELCEHGNVLQKVVGD